MVRPSGPIRFRGPGGGAAVVRLAALMFLGGASAQDSCVQVFDPSFVPSCPCDVGSDFTFSMEGRTTATAKKVRRQILKDLTG